MKQTTYEPKALMTARFKSEAQKVLAKRAGSQGRFLDIAASKGRSLESVGRMAG
ncbi:hypothetical protein NPS53_08970 [Pseudomonas putida]|uniref:hypothetical protein n=1 Tax=Pseudomonas putida TaxID=303 RepID=UPI00236320B0|nr:hypothetical protein [Pseudomonas putida]MDD2139706.1 hypothetical protein [Pseudomonas putida]HDS1721630.1 hypothetical protein [Pseudomonas putida]